MTLLAFRNAYGLDAPAATAAGVSFIDSTVTAYELALATTFTIARPTAGGALLAGDLLVFSFCVDTTTADVPFSTHDQPLQAILPWFNFNDPAAPTRFLGGAVFARLVTPAEVTTPPAAWSFVMDRGYDGTLSVVRVRGVEPSNPLAIDSSLNAAETRYTASAATTKISPAISTHASNTLMLAGMMHRSGSSTLNAGEPSEGFTLAANAQGIGGRGHAVSYRAQAAPGLSTTGTWRTSTGGIGLAWQTALRATVTVPELGATGFFPFF